MSEERGQVRINEKNIGERAIGLAVACMPKKVVEETCPDRQ